MREINAPFTVINVLMGTFSLLWIYISYDGRSEANLSGFEDGRRPYARDCEQLLDSGPGRKWMLP